MTGLRKLAGCLSSHPSVQGAGGPSHRPGGTRQPDDCAAIPNPAGRGHLLFAASGVPDCLATGDPWFAGFSAVAANLSDIAARGGRPIGVTEVLCSSDAGVSSEIWSGIRAASEAYGVPLLGRHASDAKPGSTMLSTTAIGIAGPRLITCSEARTGDLVVLVIDMHGPRDDGGPPPPRGARARWRGDLDLLPSLAEKGLCSAGQDLWAGGIAATLARLCRASGLGAEVDLAEIPCPHDMTMEDWLLRTPAFGYLLAVAPDDLMETRNHFARSRITCRPIGRFTGAGDITLRLDGETERLVFREPGVDAARDVADAGEAVREQQLGGPGGAAA